MGVDPISREVLLVGVDEPLLPELATALERRATRAARVTLTELASRDPGGVAALVLSTGAARVAQLRMVKGFIDARRPIFVLSRQADAAEKLEKTTGTAALLMSPADGAQEVASQIVAALHPAEDISNSETVRPPPGMLPKEVEEEMSGPYRHDVVDAAEKERADSEVPELESDLLESVRPSSAPPGHAVGAPPPPPAPAEARKTAGGESAHRTASSPAAGERPHAAATAPLTDAPGLGSVAMPGNAPPTPSRGGAGRAVALGVLGLGVLAVVAVGAWAITGMGGDEEPIASAAPADEPGDQEPAGERGRAPEPADGPPAPTAETAEDAPEPAEDAPTGEPAEEAPEPETEEEAPAIPSGGTPEQRIEAARGTEVERDPRESDRLVIQARQHIDAGDLTEARRVLDRALVLDPDNPRTYAWLGRLHTAGGNGALAVQWLELAVDRRPRRSEYRLWLGDALKEAGDVDGARRAWYRVRRDEGDSREVRERLQSLL